MTEQTKEAAKAPAGPANAPQRQLASQRTSVQPTTLAGAVISLQRTVGNRAVSRLVAAQSAKPLLALMRSRASDLIDARTNWIRALDEDTLGHDLLTKARAGDIPLVQEVLDTLDWSDRDDVAYGFCAGASEDDLTALLANAAGRALIDRLFDELTEGKAGGDEQAQADRLLRRKSQRIGPQAYEAGMRAAKVFPFRQGGITVLHDAPLHAERVGGGRIRVSQPTRVRGTDMFRDETATLPVEVYIGGIELPEDEIVGVRLYDLGGVTIYRPSLVLIQIANENTTATLTKIAEIAGLGLSLGAGSLAGLGIEATMTARVLLWADRAATVLGALAMVINEHRGEIIDRYGDRGRIFLRCVDWVQSATAIYGFARVALGMGRLIVDIRKAKADLRAAASDRGSADDIVNEAAGKVDDLVHKAEEIQGARSNAVPPAADAPPQGGSQAAGTTPDAPVHGPPAPEPAPGPGNARTPTRDPRADLIDTLEARNVQIRAARGDMNLFRARLRDLTADGDTPRPVTGIIDRLNELLTTQRRMRVVTGGGRSGSGVSTYVESLDGQFSIRITHNQVGANPVGRPPFPRIHLYEGAVSGHGRHVCLQSGTALADILRALGL